MPIICIHCSNSSRCRHSLASRESDSSSITRAQPRKCIRRVSSPHQPSKVHAFVANVSNPRRLCCRSWLSWLLWRHSRRKRIALAGCWNWSWRRWSWSGCWLRLLGLLGGKLRLVVQREYRRLVKRTAVLPYAILCILCIIVLLQSSLLVRLGLLIA